ncbi:tyrosine-type recombinase/integrase [Stieleria sp. TO1_6]|uniref:tyrosine-type recombinase/integrase n=1 Tax=Stieleria tagensis TaxID=2956795 RepID=UPI00209A7A2A|nr:tyrosine-type recombinase/integrase [Stieleria tagensis]MCO8123422.1 tyrosine-type recombinase/integrase [Stieleria tagensis]
MAKSTLARAKREVRLSVHKASGLWCKVHKGKRHYFERVEEDPQGTRSLDQWLEIKAGRRPRNTSGVTVKDAAEEWMQAKRSRLHAGEIVQDTYDEYFKACDLIFKSLGKETSVSELEPADFAKLRSDLAKRYGPVALGKHIGQIKSLFRYSFDAGLIKSPVRFGPSFVKPSAKVIRKQRAKRGKQDFDANEVHQLIAASGPNWKAMILLGVQAGFGNRDVAELEVGLVDLKTGWLNYPRAKTGIERRIPLWPETVAAIQAVIESHPGGTDRLFVGHRGRDFCTENRTGGNRVTGAFKPVLKAAGFPEKGRGFYCLRRTFQTQAEECGDLVAVRAIMGHSDSESDMSARYRQRVSDSRLQRTVETVWEWLYAGEVQS